jgi:hypothetical protein
MSDKPLKGNGAESPLGATDFSPGDFPLGSALSRAAARHMLIGRSPKLSTGDRDALVLYNGACYLNARMDPGSERLQGTAAYRRGQTLHDTIYGPILPAHLDPHYQRSTLASLQFEQLHGREPRAGDMLQHSDVERCYEMYLSRVARFIAAWQRQIPDTLCPLKIEDGRLYRHQMAGLGGREDPGGWREAIENRRCWEDLAYDLGVHSSEMQPISAIMFLGLIDGKHRCQPSKLCSDEMKGVRSATSPDS